MLRRTALVLGGTVLGAVVARKLAQSAAAQVGLYPTLDGSSGPAPGDMGALRLVTPPTPMPMLAFTGAAGQTTLAAHQGRPVVLNFWATWCGPCVEEMPGLDELAGKLGTRGIDVLAVSADRGGLPVVQAFFAKHAIAHLAPLADPDSDAVHAANVAGFPTTLVIDAKGMLRGQVVGKFNWPDAGPAIEKAVGVAS